MARFYPVYVRRSDGKLEVVTKGKRKELNQPTDEQLDQKPDKDGVSDFYREVAADENKHMDWRRKLGGMLARQLDWKDKAGNDQGYMLVAFPENYRLYEHIKKTEKDGKLEVKSKTHAAGGNDRQDAYLYGHPTGRRKRFRSPGDFFPHLLWLSTDESGDPDNCTCKICTPEDFESALLPAKAKPEKPLKQDPDSKPPSTQTTGQTPTARQPSQQGVQIKSETPTPTQKPATAAPRPPVPTPLPPKKTPDQQMDSMYHGFLYRPGELVWFKRGQAWGLGAILRRWSDSAKRHTYNVQPFSHPFGHPPAAPKYEAELRPWLAWSVPRFTNEGLNNLAEPVRYESVDWQGMLQKRYGNGDMEVDGSILAAKMVDASYTLFGMESRAEPQPGLFETRYNGIFLGAEKIWVGDPVRLNIGSGTDILVVHSIVERKRVSAINGQIVQQTLQFVGDVYTLATVSHSDPSIPTPASPNNNPHLPQRLTEDLAFRNARSIPAKRQAVYWRLASTQATVDLATIKGRWYEASLLLPYLQDKGFVESAQKGEIEEASLWMNSRSDCLNSNRLAQLPRIPVENTRKETRKDAFNKAVPAEAVILDGIQPPGGDAPRAGATASEQTSVPMDIDPRFETADNVARPGHGAASGTELDEFMNLDGMDEPAPMQGFGQAYGNHPGAGQGPYY